MIHVDIDYDQLAEKLAAKLGPSSTPWMSKPQAAKHLGLSVATIERRLDEIPHCRYANRILFNARQLDDWMIATNQRETR